MHQSNPEQLDGPEIRDSQRGAAAGTVVLVITFMMLAFVTALTIAVYTFTQAPST